MSELRQQKTCPTSAERLTTGTLAERTLAQRSVCDQPGGPSGSPDATQEGARTTQHPRAIPAILASAVALGLLTLPAAAAPKKPTDAQMDKVTAGTTFSSTVIFAPALTAVFFPPSPLYPPVPIKNAALFGG
jgi:hypothetical protein